MNAIKIVGQPRPEGAWLHRFRNFGEGVYVTLRDRCAVSLREIDASIDSFYVRDIPPEHAAEVARDLARAIEKHHLHDSVFVLPAADEAGGTVVLVVDPTYGERLWEIAGGRDTWVVPSEINTAAVQQMWDAREQPHQGPSLSIWSHSMSTVHEEDWLAMLHTIEIHHGVDAANPPVDTLNVYGAAVTPPIMAALRQYDYQSVKSTALGFIAFKRPVG